MEVFLSKKTVRHPEKYTTGLLAYEDCNSEALHVEEDFPNPERLLDMTFEGPLYLLLRHHEYAKIEDVTAYLQEKDSYSVSDIFDACNRWYADGLKSHVYRAYKKIDTYKIKYKRREDKPYETLMEILDLMLEKRGYRIGEEAREKCLAICWEVVRCLP